MALTRAGLRTSRVDDIPLVATARCAARQAVFSPTVAMADNPVRRRRRDHATVGRQGR